MPQICVNKVCIEFTIYHFLFLVLMVILCSLILDIYRKQSKKRKNSDKTRKDSDGKLTESLYNINYDLPETEIYSGQHMTRSTVQSRSSKDYDELNKDYDKYDFTKPQVRREKITKEEPLNPLQPGITLAPQPGRQIPNTNYPEQVPVIQIPNGGLTDYELIKQRDLGVISNPLLPPEKRTERPTIDMTLPLIRNKYIGLPTRGSYDTYQNVGYLVDQNSSDNVLKLFGRQKYAGSTQYEYYAIKSTAVDQFKVPMYNQRKQLFDGDPVTLDKIFPGNYKFMEFKQEELI